MKTKKGIVLIKNLRMQYKVSLMLGLMLLSLLLVGFIGLSTVRTTLFEDRKILIQETVAAAISIAQDYQQRVDNGEMSLGAAKLDYYRTMTSFRFADGSGYLIAFNDKAVTVLNGANPGALGSNHYNTQDADGTYMIRDFLAAAKGENDGFASYKWTKPGGGDKQYEKFTYSVLLPWGDAIGTGLYVDDIETTFWDIATQVIIITVLAIVVALILGTLISKDISKALTALQGVMQKISAGDYTIEVTGSERKDELGDMAKSVLTFREQVKENEELRASQERLEREASEKRRKETLDLADNLEDRVKKLVNAITGSISNLHNAASDMNRIADESSQRSNDVAAATEQTSANVETVAAATEELTASSDEISAQVNSSSEVASRAALQASETNNKVSGLAKAIDKIGDVVNLIDAITEQTNLLALNATIEAARAGEAGKGFAVVASEVRNLANQTAQATAEISSQIKSVQVESEAALTAVNAISGTISRVEENSTAVAAAVEEQHAAIREIARNVNQASEGTGTVAQHITEVSNNARATLTSTGTVTSAADELVNESAALEQEVENFLSELRIRAEQM